MARAASFYEDLLALRVEGASRDARFAQAQAFLANINDYDRFFNSVGSSDRASSTVSNRVAMANNGEDAGDLRSALRGCEDGSGRIYLSDGVYL